MKDNDKISHCAGISKSKTLDLEEFNKRNRIINKTEGSLTECTIEQSDYGKQNIPGLL